MLSSTPSAVFIQPPLDERDRSERILRALQHHHIVIWHCTETENFYHLCLDSFYKRAMLMDRRCMDVDGSRAIKFMKLDFKGTKEDLCGSLEKNIPGIVIVHQDGPDPGTSKRKVA